MTANFGGRRVLQDLDDLARRSWEDVAPGLYEWLNKLKRSVVDGMPAGFRNTAASALGIASTAGTEAAGWAGADHVHDGRHTLLDARLHTDTAAGTPTKGDIIAGSGAAWDDLAVGADGTVLTADSGQALGVAWKGSVANFVEAEIDFGASPGSAIAEVVVTGQTWVRATSVIVAAVTAFATTDRADGADDAIVDEIHVAVSQRVVGTGFTLRARPHIGNALGKYKIHCIGF